MADRIDDFRDQNNPQRVGDIDAFISRNAELVVGYSYFCLGIIAKMVNSGDAKIVLENSYKHFKNIKHGELRQAAKNELNQLRKLSQDSIEHDHMIFNRVF